MDFTGINVAYKLALGHLCIDISHFLIRNVFGVWTGDYITKGFVDFNSKGGKSKLKTQTQKNPKTNFKESGKNQDLTISKQRLNQK